MAEMSGLDVQRKLVDMQASIPVIFITGHGDVPMAVTALQNGAADFIQKPYRDQDLLDGINKAMTQSGAEAEDDFEVHLTDLTSRELEVYEKLLVGSSSKQIGRDLGVSPRTVDAHRHNLLQKLGFDSVKDLIVRKIALDRDR
jgi:FixJ family two-component response regulator